jgi:hypothetical protein
MLCGRGCRRLDEDGTEDILGKTMAKTTRHIDMNAQQRATDEQGTTDAPMPEAGNLKNECGCGIRTQPYRPPMPKLGNHGAYGTSHSTADYQRLPPTTPLLDLRRILAAGTRLDRVHTMSQSDELRISNSGILFTIRTLRGSLRCARCNKVASLLLIKMHRRIRSAVQLYRSCLWSSFSFRVSVGKWYVSPTRWRER